MRSFLFSFSSSDFFVVKKADTHLKVWAQISSATSRVRSMSCSPSRRTSGSMIGHRPAAVFFFLKKEIKGGKK